MSLYAMAKTVAFWGHAPSMRERCALLVRWTQAGDRASADELVRTYLHLARCACMAFFSNAPADVRDDLIQRSAEYLWARTPEIDGKQPEIVIWMFLAGLSVVGAKQEYSRTLLLSGAKLERVRTGAARGVFGFVDDHFRDDGLPGSAIRSDTSNAGLFLAERGTQDPGEALDLERIRAWFEVQPKPPIMAARFRGQSLAEIGDEQGCSRERVRQKANRELQTLAIRAKAELKIAMPSVKVMARAFLSSSKAMP